MENAVEPQFTAEEKATLHYLVRCEIAQTAKCWFVPELYTLLGKLEDASDIPFQWSYEQIDPETLEPEHVQ